MSKDGPFDWDAKPTGTWSNMVAGPSLSVESLERVWCEMRGHQIAPLGMALGIDMGPGGPSAYYERIGREMADGIAKMVLGSDRAILRGDDADEQLKVRCRAAYAPPDPRAEREARRREIDRVLADDARRFPAFATARKSAILAAFETNPRDTMDLKDGARGAKQLLDRLRSYESSRDAYRSHADVVSSIIIAPHVLAAYERCRALP